MKRVFLDMSVLVPAMVAAHPDHARAHAAFQNVGRHAHGGMAAHSLAELYAVLTRLPLLPRISPADARELIQRNIYSRSIAIVPLDAQGYTTMIDQLAEEYLQGGIVYDAVIAACACTWKADTLLTLNAADFVRLPKSLQHFEVKAP